MFYNLCTKPGFLKKIYYITILSCVIPFILNAQTPKEKSLSPQWWLGSSLADSVEQFLFHIEGQYSYTKMTGAIDGEMQSGSLIATVRKGLFTNHTELILDKMDLSLKSMGMKYVSTSHALTDYINFDFSRLIFGEAGFIWESDDVLYIKNKYTFYAGAGVNGHIYEKHFLKFLAALGNIDQEYTVPVDDFNVVKVPYAAFYIRQQYKFQANEQLSFALNSYYLKNLKLSNRYRASIGLNVFAKICDPVSIVLGYTWKYDKEAELLNSAATNTIQTIGLNISL